MSLQRNSHFLVYKDKEPKAQSFESLSTSVQLLSGTANIRAQVFVFDLKSMACLRMRCKKGKTQETRGRWEQKKMQSKM